MFKFHVKHFNFNKLENDLEKAHKHGQFVLDNAVLKDSNFYIPTDQHFLEKSGKMHSKLGKGVVRWQTPYARRLYYNPQYKFSKDKNPNAQGLWFEVAKALKLQSWLSQADKAIKSKI